MFAALFSIALVILPAINGVLAQLSIDTPNFVQCDVANITWTQSDGPYTLLVVPADDECGDAIDEVDSLTSLSTSYLVNLAAGTQVVLYLEDSDGNDAWSSNITVQSSSNSSCLESGSLAASNFTASATSPTTSSSPSSSPSATLSGADSSEPTPPPADAGSSSADSSSSSSSSDGGAVNAGSSTSSNGALPIQSFSATVMIGSVFAAFFVLCL